MQEVDTPLLQQRSWIISVGSSVNGSQNADGIDCPGLDVLILTDSFIQSLLKKHEALENDFAVHETRVQGICAQGEDILNEVSNSGIPGQAHFPKGIGPNTESWAVLNHAEF